MKKIFFTCVVFILFIHNINAQLEKNTWLLGGNFNFNQQKISGFTNINDQDIGFYKNVNYNSNKISITFNSNIGYFIIDKLVLGVNFNFSYLYDSGKYEGGFETLTKYLILDYGTFARYYLLKKEKNFNIPIIFNYAYKKNKYNNSSNDNYIKQNTFKFQTGLEYFFNSALGLEFLIGYGYTEYNQNSNLYFNNYENKYVNELLINIGFQFHLIKK